MKNAIRSCHHQCIVDTDINTCPNTGAAVPDDEPGGE